MALFAGGPMRAISFTAISRTLALLLRKSSISLVTVSSSTAARDGTAANSTTMRLTQRLRFMVSAPAGVGRYAGMTATLPLSNRVAGGGPGQTRLRD